MTSKEQVYENLRSNGLEPELVQALVDLAISEDLMGGTDVTSLATIPEIQISELDLVTRSPGVIAGINIAALVFLSVASKKIDIELCVEDGKKVEAKRGNIPVLASTAQFFDDRITNKLGENFIENKTVFFRPLENIELPYVELKYDFTDRTRKPAAKVFELKANSDYKFKEAVKVKQFSIDELKYGEYRVLENAYYQFRIIVKEKGTQENTFNCDVFKYYKDGGGNQKVSKKSNVLIEFLDSDGYKTNKTNTI